jgi:uncharacterized protein YfaP (DUF2135 family)
MVACSDGQSGTVGGSKLVRFHDGNGSYAGWISGSLPGTPADNDVVNGVAEGVSGPTVLFDTAPGWVYQGQSNAKYEGRLSAEAVAVGMAVQDLENGYWVRPAGASDPVTKELTWNASIDVSEDVASGKYSVTFVAIDEAGNAGAQVEQTLCVRSRVPDNLNACEPSLDAPNAVISLKWDSNVDLDLQVVDPKGNVIDAKHPTTTPVGDVVDPLAGVLDLDSNANCVIDGVRYENLVWEKSKPAGRYGMYVNLFSACKQPAVHFEVSVWVAKAVNGAGQTLKKYYSQSGVLTDYQANGGDGRGLFIAEFDFK